MFKNYEASKRSYLYILSGEGCTGTRELYTGKLTRRALKSRLTKEMCGGHRWAMIITHDRRIELTYNDLQ